MLRPHFAFYSAPLLHVSLWLTAACAALSTVLCCAAGQAALSAAEVEAVVGGEVRAALADRIRWEHVAAFQVLQDPFR